MRIWLIALILAVALAGGGTGCKWRTVKLYDVTCLPWRCIANAEDGRGLHYTTKSRLFENWREGQVITLWVCR